MQRHQAGLSRREIDTDVEQIYIKLMDEQGQMRY
jgi:hypothetical protein